MTAVGQIDAKKAAVLAVVLACMASAAAQQPKKDVVRAEFARLVEAIRDDAASLDEAWYRFLPRLTAGQADPAERWVLLRLVLAQSLYGKDLTVELYRREDRWVRGRAWAPAWNEAEHQVDAAGLVVDAARQTVAGRLRVRLMFDGLLPMGGKCVDCAFDVKGAMRGETVKGTFSTVPPESGPPPIQPAEGAVTGRLSPVARLVRPIELPAQKMGRWDVFQLYAAARRLESDAERAYQMIRAVELARTYGLPYTRALAEAPVYEVVREDFEPAEVEKQREREKSGPSASDAGLDLGDELGELGIPAAPKVTTLAPDDPKALRGLATLRAIRARTGRMLRFVERREQAGLSAPAHQTGGLTTADPDFGPWYGEEALPYDEQTGRHALPAGAGGKGLQKWPCVGTWRLIGPFPPATWRLNTPLLPEVVFDLQARHRVDRGALKFGRSYKGPRLAGWTVHERERSFGYICPPNWSSSNRFSAGCSRCITDHHSGLEHSCLYACTEVDSPEDVDLWVAIGLTQQGKLWIDDRLAWTGPAEVDERASQHVLLQRLRFHKGVNRLLLRCDVGYASPSFWLRVCTQGRPRDAAAVEAHRQVVAKARAAVAKLAGSCYRGDRTGNFPDAEPPVAWDYKRKINVIWRTPLPYWSNASPVLAGDRLFVAMEPHTLVCLRKSDGQVLWQRPVTIIDLLDDKDRAEGWRLYNAWWAARQARDAVPRSVLRPEKWIDRSRWYWDEQRQRAGQTKDERQGASPELVALLDRRDALEKHPEPDAVREELTKVLDRIEQLKAGQVRAGGEDPQEKVARLRERWHALIQFLGKHSRVRGLGGYWYDYDGYAFATPVTDGRSVWWKNGMGTAACFDMAGNRKWMVRTGGGGSQSPTAPSPLLIDGKVIIKGPNYYEVVTNKWSGQKATRTDGERIIALDAATGALIWEAKPLPRLGWNWGANTPLPLTLTNGRETMTVLVTSGGSVVRVDDGKVLVRNVGAHCEHASVVWGGDDIAIFPRPHLVAYRLILVDRDTVGFKRIWSHQLGSHGIGYHGCTVSDDGLLYHETGFGHYYYRWPFQTESGPGERRAWCIVKDARTGREVAHAEMYRKGCHYWALSAVTRNHVFMVGGDNIFATGPVPPSSITVLTRGPEPVAVARNVIERTYGSPVFEGARMYIRGYQGVTCVGYTGEAGRRYEARVVAGSILDELHADAPRGAPAPLRPAALSGTTRNRAPSSRLENNRAPHSWLLAGPFPIAAAEAILGAVSEPGVRPQPGEAVGPGGAWQVMDNREIKAPGVLPWETDPNNFTLLHAQRRIFDVGKAIGGRAGTVSYLYAEMRSDRPQVMRFEQKTPGVRAWIGGRQLADGGRVRFDEGTYGLLLEVRVEKLGPGGLLLSPRFWSSDDARKELQAYLGLARRHRAYLESVVKLAPDSCEAQRARKVLEEL